MTKLQTIVKPLNVNTLAIAMNGASKGGFVSIDTITDDTNKMTAANKKVVQGLRTVTKGLVFNGNRGAFTEWMKKENPDYIAQPEKNGATLYQPLDINPDISRHDRTGKTYVAFYWKADSNIAKNAKVTREKFVNGRWQEISLDEHQSLLVNSQTIEYKRAKSDAYSSRNGLQDTILMRRYKLDSITRIAMGGEVLAVA